MKKIFALILALIMCFGVFVACGDEEESIGGGGKKNPTAADDYKEFEKAMEKTQALESLSAKMDMDITVSAEGITMEVPMDMTIKIKDAKSEKPTTYVDLKMTMMGMEVAMEMYQEDEWCYYVSDGEKYKISLEEAQAGDGADFTHNLDGLMQELSEDIMKKASIESNGDGSKTLTVKLSEEDFAEYFGEYMEGLGYGVDGATIEEASVSMTAKDGYLTVYEMNMEMEIIAEGITTKGVAKISATYDDPGEEVEITPPEGYKDFPELTERNEF